MQREGLQSGALALPLISGGTSAQFVSPCSGPGVRVIKWVGVSHDKETPRGCCRGAARRRRSGTALAHGAVCPGTPGAAPPPEPGFESRLRHRLAENPQVSDFTILRRGRRRNRVCALLPYRESGGPLSAMRAQKGGCDAAPRDPSPLAAPQEWPGLGLTGARGGRTPHRACATPRAPGGGRDRDRASSGPSRLSLPVRPGSTSIACPSAPCLGGRPLLPGTHRYQRGGLPAAPSPQARRRRRLRLSPPSRRRTKAPPTDPRGHEAMAVGAESGGRGRARSGKRSNVAIARGFTAGLSRECQSP